VNENRLEVFSDGVFAVAITLLIFNVRPTPGKTATLEALRDALPQVLSFLLSFVIAGVYWVAHHSMLQFVRAFDQRLLWLNLLPLLVVVFIPFPASCSANTPETRCLS
jgi:TMEM175 potassium channel family protein